MTKGAFSGKLPECNVDIHLENRADYYNRAEVFNQLWSNFKVLLFKEDLGGF